jgi:hypothetical protein
MSLAKAADYWDQTGNCHPDFIRMNSANLQASDLSDWFTATTSSLEKNNTDAYKRTREGNIV